MLTSFLQLNPPPDVALYLMHRLASDPGIVAVVEKVSDYSGFTHYFFRLIGIFSCSQHKWTVQEMTEMPPEGYVGVSPVCLLGFNKVWYYVSDNISAIRVILLILQNKGEEISLRLRTDDLSGFRKYESIRNTLLHELVIWNFLPLCICDHIGFYFDSLQAHMVHSDHDDKFKELNSQVRNWFTGLHWSIS